MVVLKSLYPCTWTERGLTNGLPMNCPLHPGPLHEQTCEKMFNGDSSQRPFASPQPSPSGRGRQACPAFWLDWAGPQFRGSMHVEKTLRLPMNSPFGPALFPAAVSWQGVVAEGAAGWRPAIQADLEICATARGDARPT